MNTHIIYAGGTFGSFGAPLNALPADEFIPVLSQLLKARLPDAPTIVPSPVIRDSSTLTPNDFVQIYQRILALYHADVRQMVLVTGTDSLSFLAAFLANALDGLHDLALIITGSMYPLLHPQRTPYVINDDSDAWQNLSHAINLSHDKTGVFVAFAQHVYDAHNTLKIDSQNTDAFIGAHRHHPTDGAVSTPLPIDDLRTKAQNVRIKSIYLTPNDPAQLAHELHHGMDSHAVILIAYGAGNVPHSDTVAAALQALHAKNIPVVCTTMCAYGGVSSAYRAGAWQYEYGVWSGGVLGVAGIYGRLLWLALTDRLTHDAWQTTLPSTPIAQATDTHHA